MKLSRSVSRHKEKEKRRDGRGKEREVIARESEVGPRKNK